MIEAIAIIWSISAFVCWEAHGKALLANNGYWVQRTLRSLCPVFNTWAAYKYVAYYWKNPS